MRISEFASKYNVKKSTIRYYTDEKLLYPRLSTNGYDYNHKCDNDMRDIIDYRNIGFTIEDIKKIILYKRFTQTFVDQELSGVIDLLDYRKRRIEDEIDELRLKLKQIENHKNQLLNIDNTDIIGLPLSCIGLLKCSNCNSEIRLTDCEVTAQGVINGKIICDDCKAELAIDDGIIDARSSAHINIGKDMKFEYSKNWHNICDFLYELEARFKDNRGFWDNGNVYLFNGADTEIIAMSLLSNVNTSNTYIFADKSKSLLRSFKKKLEVQNIKGKFIFICHEDKIPLKQCVDRLVDVFGIHMNALYKESTSNLSAICKSLVDGCEYIGSYILFDNHVEYEKYDLSYFNKSKVDTILQNSNIVLDKRESVESNVELYDLLPSAINGSSNVEISIEYSVGKYIL